MSEALPQQLAQIPMFSTLQADALQALAPYLLIREVAAGEHVFREGEKGDSVCFVLSGSLDVIKLSQIAQPVVITRLGPGCSIGEMALLDRLTRSASVRANGPARLAVLTRECFEVILAQHPDTGIQLLKGIALLLSMSLRKTSDRLAEFMPPLA